MNPVVSTPVTVTDVTDIAETLADNDAETTMGMLPKLAGNVYVAVPVSPFKCSKTNLKVAPVNG